MQIGASCDSPWGSPEALGGGVRTCSVHPASQHPASPHQAEVQDGCVDHRQVINDALQRYWEQYQATRHQPQQQVHQRQQQQQLEVVQCAPSHRVIHWEAQGERKAEEHLALVLSPDDALLRRQELLAEAKAKRAAGRIQARADRRWQHRQGLRPARARRGQYVQLVSANVTAAGSLRHELENGSTFANADYLLVQEHKLSEPGLDVAAGWAAKCGWRLLGSAAYVKEKALGGGTAIMSRDVGAVRPAPGGYDVFRGRLGFGLIDLDGDVLIGSGYGVSGEPPSQQLPVWRAVAVYLRSMGLPFAIGADWQCTPDELQQSGLPELLGAEVFAPRQPTNTDSGRVIDFFLVSIGLVLEGAAASVLHGSVLATHLPVAIRLNARRPVTHVTRLTRPKPLPIDRPIGPQLPGIHVQWQSWNSLAKVEGSRHFDETKFSAAVESWYAGAECELNTVFGNARVDSEGQYLGLGMQPVEVSALEQGRFRSVPDELGLIGHRMAWAARGLRILQAYGPCWESQRDPEAILHLWGAIGHRAAAFLREPRTRSNHLEAEAALRRGLQLLAAVVRPHHGQPPSIFGLIEGDTRSSVRAGMLSKEIEHHQHGLAVARRRKTAEEARQWARSATISAGHRVTKAPSGTVPLTASANKSHRGGSSAQEAADAGIAEWCGPWQARSWDGAEDILKAIEAWDCTQQEEPDVALPPLEPRRLLDVCKRFRSGTGVGRDWLRPRHVALLSSGAQRALCKLLACIEAVRRWPMLLREVIAVALGKKSGGCRLIGLATAIYRIWAKVRYYDCRAIMEARLKRPYFAAAPGVGAAKAAFDATLAGEVAAAEGHESACVLADLKQFYEHVEVPDFALGARNLGLPLEVVALSAHLYLGPRCIRVGNAHSRRMFPRRSILAGCTWATVHVRLFMVKPADMFCRTVREQLQQWELTFRLNIYIDDSMLGVSGKRHAIAHCFPWVSSLLLHWLLRVLRKPVAMQKLQCVASSVELKNAISARMQELSIPVVLIGETLGIDHAAGGRLSKRPVQRRRLRMAWRRRSRISWWRRLGGNAVNVVRSGASPAVEYGAECIGLTDMALRQLRRIYSAAVGISCGGSSLTARLALGGCKYEDIDPGVINSNTPLLALASRIWDDPQVRNGYVRAWLAAKADAREHGSKWRWVRGPVGAAWLSLARVQAEWVSPFVVRLLDKEVSLLETPPLQVKAILQAHARRHFDTQLIGRLVNQSQGWDGEAVILQYRHGIDWALLRRVLLGKEGNLSPAEKAALRVVACGGFWPEERRWLAGLSGHGTCEACCEATGSPRHRLYQCEPLQFTLHCARCEERLPARALDREWSRALEPLATWGLPPRAVTWQPIPAEDPQGDISVGHAGLSFGDGSGQHQSESETAVAAWAVVRMDGSSCCSEVRGVADGWFPTVPRAELSALVWHLRLALCPATYVGDCANVIRGALMGVTEALTSARSLHADLWRQVAWLLSDHGPGLSFVKTKAHRSRAEAERSADDPLQNWRGNQAADAHAKELCLSRASTDARWHETCRLRERTLPWLCHVGIAAAWCFRHWPESSARRRRRKSPARIGDVCDGLQIRKPLSKRPCTETVAALAHPTHSLMETKGVLWCCKCGAYARRVPRALRRPCVAGPRSEAYACLLRRFRKGLVPARAASHKNAAISSTPGVSRPRRFRRESSFTQLADGPMHGAVVVSAAEGQTSSWVAAASRPGGNRDASAGVGSLGCQPAASVASQRPAVVQPQSGRRCDDDDEAAVLADMRELEKSGLRVVWPCRR